VTALPREAESDAPLRASTPLSLHFFSARSYLSSPLRWGRLLKMNFLSTSTYSEPKVTSFSRTPCVSLCDLLTPLPPVSPSCSSPLRVSRQRTSLSLSLLLAPRVALNLPLARIRVSTRSSVPPPISFTGIVAKFDKSSLVGETGINLDEPPR